MDNIWIRNKKCGRARFSSYMDVRILRDKTNIKKFKNNFKSVHVADLGGFWALKRALQSSTFYLLQFPRS